MRSLEYKAHPEHSSCKLGSSCWSLQKCIVIEQDPAGVAGVGLTISMKDAGDHCAHLTLRLPLITSTPLRMLNAFQFLGSSDQHDLKGQIVSSAIMQVSNMSTQLHIWRLK